MRIEDKRAATTTICADVGVPQGLEELCQRRLDGCADSYATSRDIEDRHAPTEILEEVADILNIAAMAERIGKLGQATAHKLAFHAKAMYAILQTPEA